MYRPLATPRLDGLKVEQTQYGKPPSCIRTKVGDQRAPIRPLVSDLGPKHSQTGSEEMGRIPAFAAVVGHEARDRAHTECADKPSQEGATASENRAWTDHATRVRAKTLFVRALGRHPELFVRPKASTRRLRERARTGFGHRAA